MELTKQQTLEIYINNSKINANKIRYKYTTKYKWWCLGCLDPIYISYKQYGRNVIFCPECYIKFQRKPTIVQYQYIRILKEKQLKIIEGQLNNYIEKTMENI